MTNLKKISRKITFTLLVTQILFAIALIINVTATPIIVVELAGGNKQWSGVPATLTLIGAALISYPIGRLMDSFGRRVGLSLGYLFGIVGTVLAGWAVIIHSLPLFLFGIFNLGINNGTNNQSRYAAAEATPPEWQARAISIVIFGSMLGSIVAPALIKWIAKLSEWLDIPIFSTPWFVASLLLTLSLLVLTIFLRPDPQQIARQFATVVVGDEGTSPAMSKSENRPYREIFRNANILLAVGTLIFGQLAMVLVMTITPIHMYDYQYSLSIISWVIVAHVIGMFGFSFITGWLVDKWGQAKIIFLGGLILVVACLIAPLYNSVGWLIGSLFLLGLGWNLCFVAGSALLTVNLRSNEKGQIQGLVDALVFISSGIGSISSGFIFAAWGFQTMSWLTVFVAVVPIILVLMLPAMKQKMAMVNV